MDLAALARSLRSEAERSEERRGIVLAGEREAGLEAARLVLGAAEIEFGDVTVVGPPNQLPADTVSTNRADKLLGTTKDAVVLDAHEELRPNAVGQVVGAVDGGGLFVVLAPPLSQWAERRDGFDERLAVPPFERRDVGGRFKRRFLERLQVHRGIAIVDVDGEWVEDDGLTDPAPRLEDGRSRRGPPKESTFPPSVYDRCLTGDQAAAVGAFEVLNPTDTRATDPRAIVLEADRGRGKSSTAGLAAGALAVDGADVLVTAPQYDAAAAIFERAAEVLADLDVAVDSDGEPPKELRVGRDPDDTDDERESASGHVRFRTPSDAVEVAGDADLVIVDEAAALPVARLEAFLAADRVAFATTIHGYEGAGRGFSVRFRDRLAESRHDVDEVRLDEPIRYAAGDPIEAWAFDALLLDARPAVDQVVEDATPGSVEYRRLPPEDLLADEHLLREAFGLLVLAHYRTEPDDLARLLDAPNVAVRALVQDGHVAAVALLAREGGLGPDRRAAMYDGERIRGHMLPDVFTSQLRDERAAIPVGARVLRIATHPAARRRGLGSRLLARLRTEATDGLPEWNGAPRPAEASDRDGLDWLGVGYGATPDLLRFWASCGYRTVHLATTRNDRSGEYSALMVDPISEAGQELHDRTARRFGGRIGDVLGDALDDAEPDVVRAALSATDATAAPPLNLTDWEWRVVASAAYGPGLADVAPGPFRSLAARHLIDPLDPEALDDTGERLLVRKALQSWDWDAVASDVGYHSTGMAMRDYGDAFEPLVSLYGTDVALEERARYVEADETPALEGETLPGSGANADEPGTAEQHLDEPDDGA
ncbi:putative P-loop ATPase fused to an acetyltransferase [Salinarchaeum sp. Harcht-Bsk1]|uniref:tRNA(Met) cytidine acetyltransferase TmcA n=1 Tax=Salinarchaeum sp. Harcht-Bsk1 TaxID=1333523 RepID=UPI00034247BA|nr:tRNA(Met) cytidine acetyltransferase TmcA [Salinarchaeum sp. Harcht-Bsk1]AGN00219.1 putative P-loop ATPase fused to an acetyltransferase [Salinarchaeum sp. Harcht-Bsk1]